MKLILNSPEEDNSLSKKYHQAFNNAEELFLVTAYLTDWDESLVLNEKCKSFRVIVGKDFGITRKDACRKLMKWLPKNKKSRFLVADQISGFHPKALFWKSRNEKYFSIIGSSNLTKAAFNTNFEANISIEVSKKDYLKAKAWVSKISNFSVVVSEDWLSRYVEGISKPYKGSRKKKENDSNSVFYVQLPEQKGYKRAIIKRRKGLRCHKKSKKAFLRSFNLCAKKEISSADFYESLPSIWSYEVGNKFQSDVWVISGKNSDFQELASSFISIYESSHEDRDDVVLHELNRLDKNGNSLRRSFLSEMLSLTFPEDYPIWNEPIDAFLRDIGFKAPKGASFGDKYLDIAHKLRVFLQQNSSYPARNLLELDAAIEHKYRKND